jgi:uncharacterized protein (TIGR00369 family)
MNDSVYKPLKSSGANKCFGCSPVNPHGLQMTFFGNQKEVCSYITVPRHMCGWNKLVHGGIISVILDEIMSWAALHVYKKMVLTKSMTVDFIKPVSIKHELKAIGRPIKTVGRHEVLVQGEICDPKGEICARASGTFVLLNPKTAKRMGIVDDDGLKGIENIINPLPEI